MSSQVGSTSPIGEVLRQLVDEKIPYQGESLTGGLSYARTKTPWFLDYSVRTGLMFTRNFIDGTALRNLTPSEAVNLIRLMTS